MSKNNNNNTPSSEQKVNPEDVAGNDAAAAEVESFDDIEEALDENEADDPMQRIEALTAELNAEREKVAKEKKEYLFLMAEFDNFRKRTVREKGDIIRNASEKVLSGLLPIVDDFERGLEANRNSSDAQAVKEGMELIYNKLIKYLEQNGVKAIDSTGADFDPDIHEAIAMVPVEDPALKGKVIDTPTRGYMINDKVLRHAKVAVGQ